MQRQVRALLAAAVAACALTGCASTPQASAGRDAEAKLFIPQPADATIYIYRPDKSAVSEDDTVIWINGRLIGASLPQTYFQVYAVPGIQALKGIAPDNGQLRLEVRPGEIYFVRLQVLGGQSFFSPVEASKGRQELTACCVLLENWRPGQRPLLR